MRDMAEHVISCCQKCTRIDIGQVSVLVFAWDANFLIYFSTLLTSTLHRKTLDL